MPRGRKRVCVLCGKTITDNNDSVPYKGRYAHSACFNVAIKAIHVDKNEKLNEKQDKNSASNKQKAKPQVELKDGLSEEEYIQKKLYYDFLKINICEQLPVKIYALTENYIKKYNFTFQGMYQTLTYIKNILEKEFGDSIVGLIPYYYTEADLYYKTVKKIAEANKDKDPSTMYKNKTIYIDTTKKQKKQLDITSIREG